MLRLCFYFVNLINFVNLVVLCIVRFGLKLGVGG